MWSARRDSNPAPLTGGQTCCLEHLGRVGDGTGTRTPMTPVAAAALAFRSSRRGGSGASRTPGTLVRRFSKPLCKTDMHVASVEEGGGLEPHTVVRTAFEAAAGPARFTLRACARNRTWSLERVELASCRSTTHALSAWPAAPRRPPVPQTGALLSAPQADVLLYQLRCFGTDGAGHGCWPHPAALMRRSCALARPAWCPREVSNLCVQRS